MTIALGMVGAKGEYVAHGSEQARGWRSRRTFIERSLREHPIIEDGTIG